MIRVYINYPNPHLAIHHDLSCGNIMQGRKNNQRHLDVDASNRDRILARFRTKDFRFASTSEFNDMWLEVDLGNTAAEETFVQNVKAELSRHYRPFIRAKVIDHC
jgi:hypothetical protein